MRRVAVVGSTGSIGRQTLDVVRCHRDKFQVVALAAGSSVDVLAAQAHEFQPRTVAVYDAERAAALEGLLESEGIRVLAGEEGIRQVAAEETADVVVVAPAGLAGVDPAMAAVKTGKVVALANKESIVCLGEELMQLARRKGTTIVPVDSEHSAVFQCLGGSLSPRDDLDRIILTCSGGPFLNADQSALESAGPAEVLRHPTWRMGPKITVDSATLMNKAFEVIEASVLFGVDVSRVQVVIHPESIVHSMVVFKDGAALAQLGWPDMRVPIQYALSYPQRLEPPGSPFDPSIVGKITFYQPDREKFPCLGFGYEMARVARSYRVALVAADDVAVGLFLERRMRFADIPRLIRRVLDLHKPVPVRGLEDAREVAEWAKRTAFEEAKRSW